jgi:membrane associated rhomboid family serine protease
VSGADLFVICKSCGSEVSPYITECPYCGNRLRKRAPKLDRPGSPPQHRRRRRRVPQPSLGRLRPGEIPGVRADSRPYATAVLVIASALVTLLARTALVSVADVGIVGPVEDRPWQVLTAPFVYDNTGYLFVSLLTIAVFGWLLERRHGHVPVVVVFLLGSGAGMAAAAAADPAPLALGGNGAALALLCAWLMRDVRALRRGEEIESDLLGVGVFAAAVLAMPLADDQANVLAGAGGAVVGLVIGFGLARLARE